MNDLLQRLIDELKGTSLGTKLVALLTGASCIAILAVAGVVSSRPDYQLLFSGLTDHEVAKVNKALSEAGIPFECSSAPAPFNVFVDESDRIAASAAAYGAGALDKPLQGILAESGMGSVFNSAEERSQSVRKREWQEMERMLESLDFVQSAYVRTSPGGRTSIGSRTVAPTTASVVLRTGGGLTEDQGDTIAKMVSNGLGVGRDHLVISDQEGNTLFDGGTANGKGSSELDHLAYQDEYDNRLTERANEVLESILGPNKARVTVTSVWNFEQSTSRTEQASKGALLEEVSNTSERPSTPQGGAAGVGANTATASGNDDPQLGGASANRSNERTNQQTKTYRPVMAIEERVNYVPRLQRLAVALYIDESVEAERAEELATAVQASVGYDADRSDQFSSVTLPFFTPEVSEETGVEEEGGGGIDPTMEMLLRRGVEIVTALVFVILLLKTLKSSNATAKTTEATGEPGSGSAAAGTPAEEVDPELLARAHVEELLQSDPDKIGALLSSWAREERAA